MHRSNTAIITTGPHRRDHHDPQRNHHHSPDHRHYAPTDHRDHNQMDRTAEITAPRSVHTTTLPIKGCGGVHDQRGTASKR
jgi:hypothetical protein